MCVSVSVRGSMCDRGRRKTDRQTDRQSPWLPVGPDATEVPLSASGGPHKWRVRGWVGGLYVRLKEVGMDGKGTLKMFTRKKRELIKTPSMSKKSGTGSPGPHGSTPTVSQSITSGFCRVRACVRVLVSDDLRGELGTFAEGAPAKGVNGC